MAVNTDPVFGKATAYAGAIATAANTNLDGTTGTYYTLVTAGADGAIVTSLKAMCRATVTATACRLFISVDGGTTYYLHDEKTMAAYTVANTTSQTPVIFVNKLNPDDAIRLPANAILRCSIAVALAGGIAFTAEYTSLTA